MSSLRTCYLILPTVLAIVALAFLTVTFLDQITASSSLLTSLYFLKLDTSNLTLPNTSVESALVSTAVTSTIGQSYTIGLWNFCSTAKNGTFFCSPPKFGYAFNPLEAWGLNENAASAVEDALLPETWDKALETYRMVSKWMFIAYLAAMIASVVTILMGALACALGRFSACCTALFAWIAALLSIAASVSATALFITVKGILQKELEQYGLKTTLGSKLLTYSWIGSGFALGAALTWMFGCCCSAGHRDKKSSKWDRDVGYQPLVGPYYGHHKQPSEDFAMHQRQWPGQTAYAPVQSHERV